MLVRGGNPFARGADRQRFQEFYAELEGRGDGKDWSNVTRQDAVCVAPIKYNGLFELQRDIDNLKRVAAEPSFAQCRGPRDVGYALTFGQGLGSPEPVDLEQSKLIVLIGSHLGENVFTSQITAFANGLARGAKLIAVDPRFSTAAAKADWWLPIRPGTDAALAYLRSVVCNLTRMRLRHLQVVRKHAAPREHGVRSAESSAETEALLQDDQRALVSALKELPARQREALVLRHWLGLREAEIAEAMGISNGAVKSHTSRGMAALTRAMEERR